MYTLVRSRRVPELVAEQAPSLAASLLIAETFYKFGSFALECLAFLATWYALDAAVHAAKHVVTRRR